MSDAAAELAILARELEELNRVGAALFVDARVYDKWQVEPCAY